MSGETDFFLIVAAFLPIYMLLSAIRIIKGPTVPDRVVGLDTLNTLVVALLVVLSAAFRTPVYVDVAIVYAVLSFIGTLFIAKYIEGGM